MIDVSKIRGLVGVAVAVLAAVAGALNAPDVKDALDAAGLTADQAISGVVALVAAVQVVIGAVTNKVQPKEAAAVEAVKTAVKADPVSAPGVVKEAVASAKADVAAGV